MTGNVIFLHSIDDSFGEREHALRFGQGLAAAGVHPVHLINPAVQEFFARLGVVARYYNDPGEAMAIIDAIAPRLVVCCDYLNLHPELQAAVARTRWPLATMEGSTLGAPVNLIPLRTAAALRELTLPAHMARLRPCPVNDPLSDGEGVFHWSLFPGVGRHDGKAARAQWGVSPKARLVLMAVAPWARGAATHLGRMQHFQFLSAAVGAALDACGERYEMIIVLGAQGVTHTRMGRLRCVPLLQPDVYEELLLGCDLVVTDNVIQTSAAKALAAGVPVLALVNSTPGAPGGPLAEPYNIFPLAMTFPTDSAYYRALAPVELGDAAAIRLRISSIWHGAPRRGAAYFESLAGLRTPAEIVAAISPAT